MAKIINLKPFRSFFKSESTGGILLMISVVISLIIANSSAGLAFESFLKTTFGFTNSYIDLDYSVIQWVNDGLMAVFFLMVGLEIKRELVEGELSSIKQASLPIMAAIGGMLLPALIFSMVNNDPATSGGWGIPMATDIAFAIAILSLLGNKVPSSLRVFLTALAIVDDLGAIVVIAIFYSSDIHINYLLYAGGVFVFLIGLNYFGVKKLYFYLIPGIIMWYFIHHSGVHATIAGVLTALTIPTNADDRTSPLERLEHILVRPVNFIIMPLFAIANTNIRFESGMVEHLTTSLSLGIICGLMLGKPIGIFFFSWFSVKLKISKLPAQATWLQIGGLGLLGGIGFTMSIFIALLSYSSPDHQTQAKFSILLASVSCGLIAYGILKYIGKKKKRVLLKNPD